MKMPNLSELVIGPEYSHLYDEIVKTSLINAIRIADENDRVFLKQTLKYYSLPDEEKEIDKL